MFNCIDILLLSFRKPVIFIPKFCKNRIHNHLTTSSYEMGGLLLGHVFSLPYHTKHGYDFCSFITRVIPSLIFNNSAVSLTMHNDIWSNATKHLDSGEIVIGWYHSHPNIGAFFSGRDVMTQRASFRNEYSLGLVIDPYRNETKCFAGPDSVEICADFEEVSSLVTWNL